MLKAAIDEAGYDILGTPSEETLSSPRMTWSDSLAGIAGVVSPKRQKHLDNCAQCRAEHVDGSLPEKDHLEVCTELVCHSL